MRWLKLLDLVSIQLSTCKKIITTEIYFITNSSLKRFAESPHKGVKNDT